MFGNAQKFASIEARLSQLETLTTELNSAHERIKSQETIIANLQSTIEKLIASQIDYAKLSTAVAENIDYEPLTEAVLMYVESYDFDYDEIASHLENSVTERVVNDVNWDEVLESYATDLVGDDYSKLVQLIADQLDVSEAVSDAVSEAVSDVVNNDLDFDSAITDWLEDNGEDLVAQNISSDTIFDAITNDIDVEGCSSRELVEALMVSFEHYNNYRTNNGQSPIEVGGGSSLDLESLGEQIKAFIETHTATSEADAIGDYSPLEWQVLMTIRKAVLEVLS